MADQRYSRHVATGDDYQELRGLIADRPPATSVPVGTTWWAVDRILEADEFSVSTGTSWVNF